ncbi:hypothetical protein ACFL2K_03480, partial [Candidatus Margulisiibacteriota bacterium]
IENGAHLEAFTYIEGPAYIGKNSKILGGKVTACSIGHNCKIAGEVSNSIFLSYSNKAHAGFIGHSYICEWVNLGAMTTNSNLKNTYSEIKLNLGKEQVNTNQIFLGAMIGDYVKTGIGTLLNTGSIIGFGSTLFGPNIHDKYIAPFTWGEKGNYGKHQLDKFFQTAVKMMLRRGQELTVAESEVIEELNNG